MTLELIKYTGYTFLFLIVLFTPAFFLANQGNAKSRFGGTFIGGLLILITIVSVYSIYYTKFVTIYIFVLPLSGFLFFSLLKYRSFKKTKSQLKEYAALITSVLTATVSIYFIQLLFPYPESISNDILFYTKIAENLSLSGNENTFQHFNNQSEYFTGTFPYHYFELWISNMLFKIFPSVSTAVVLKYITYPLLKTASIWGLWSLLKDRNKQQLYLIPIIALITTLPLNQLTDLGGNSWSIITDIWIRPNFISYFLFLVPLLYFLIEEKYELLIAWLLFLPLVSTTTAPAVYSSLIVIVGFMRWKNLLTTNQAIKWIILIVISAIGIILFYSFTSANLSSAAAAPQGINSYFLTLQKLWKAILFMSITLSLRVAFFVAILIGSAYFIWQKKDNRKHSFFQFALIACLLSFTGIIVFQLVPTVDNTYQFPYVGYAALHLLTIYFLITIFNSEKSRSFKLRVIVPVLIWITVYLFQTTDPFVFKSSSTVNYNLSKKGYSQNAISRLTNFFNEHPNAQGAYYITPESLSTIPPKKRHALTFQPGNEISFLTNYGTLLPVTPDSVLYADFNNEPEVHAKAKSFNRRIPGYTLINSKEMKVSLTQLKCNFLVSTGIIKLDFLRPIAQTKNLYFYEVRID